MAKWDRLAIKSGNLRMIGNALALEPCRCPVITIKDSTPDAVSISRDELRAYQVMGDRPGALAWAPFYMYLHNRMHITATAQSSFSDDRQSSVMYLNEDGKQVVEQVNGCGGEFRAASLFVLATFKISFAENFVHDPSWTEGSPAEVLEKYGVYASLPTDTHRSYDRYFQLISTCSMDMHTGEVSIYREKKVIKLYDETGHPFDKEEITIEGVDFDVKMEDVEYPE